jgi:hypothetical protein
MGQSYQDWGFLQNETRKLDNTSSESSGNEMIPEAENNFEVNSVQFNNSVAGKSPEKLTDNLTEKSIVLDSLQRFTQKVKERGIDKIAVSGGEVVIKAPDHDGMQLIALNAELTIDKYLAQHSQVYGEHITQARLKRFSNQSGLKPKVYFLVDKLSLEPLYTAPHPGFEELRFFFSEETSVLFSKMIQAMKLTSQDYVIGPINFQEADGFDYRFELAWLQPQLVMTLGATATNDLLSIHERLNNIHGKFFARKILSSLNPYEFLVMPLFNPEFLRINPSMKKTAWDDMQKAMKKIGN